MNGEQEQAIWQTFWRSFSLVLLSITLTVGICCGLNSYHTYVVQKIKAENFDARQQWLSEIFDTDRRIDGMMSWACANSANDTVNRVVEYRKAVTLSQLLKYRTYLQDMENKHEPNGLLIQLPPEPKEQADTLQASLKKK